MRKTTSGAEPKSAVFVTERGSETTCRQSVGCSEMPEVSRLWIEAIETSRSADINTSCQIFDQQIPFGLSAIARQTLLGRVVNERWPVSLRLVNANQPAARRCQPKPASVIGVDAGDHARRQSLIRRK